MNDWFESREYWRNFRSFIWTEQKIRNSRLGAELALERLGASRGESILDLACGFGRHSIEFSKLGLAVTGVDLNGEFINEAKEKAAGTSEPVRFVQADMRNFVESGAFNSIVIMYNSFGYFQSRSDDEKVIGNCFNSLKPGGKLLISVTGAEMLSRTMPNGSSRYWFEENGCYWLQDCSFSQENSLLRITCIKLRGNEKNEFSYKVRIFSRMEMAELLKKAGFEKPRFFGSLKGDPYDNTARSMTVVAGKPAK